MLNEEKKSFNSLSNNLNVTSNKTIAGLRTLHHSNLGSPYQSYCMTDISKPYADACILYSFNVYKKAGAIKEKEGKDDDKTSTND